LARGYSAATIRSPNVVVMSKMVPLGWNYPEIGWMGHLTPR
jgi:hypothetical protein